MLSMVEVGDLWVLTLAAQEWLRDHPTNPNREEVAKAVGKAEEIIQHARGVKK